MSDETPIFEIQPKHYRCQKHGDIGGRVLSVAFYDDNLTYAFDYCGYCCNEMLAKHCHQAEPVK